VLWPADAADDLRGNDGSTTERLRSRASQPQSPRDWACPSTPERSAATSTASFC